MVTQSQLDKANIGTLGILVIALVVYSAGLRNFYYLLDDYMGWFEEHSKIVFSYFWSPPFFCLAIGSFFTYVCRQGKRLSRFLTHIGVGFFFCVCNLGMIVATIYNTFNVITGLQGKCDRVKQGDTMYDPCDQFTSAYRLWQAGVLLVASYSLYGFIMVYIAGPVINPDEEVLPPPRKKKKKRVKKANAAAAASPISSAPADSDVKMTDLEAQNAETPAATPDASPAPKMKKKKKKKAEV